MGYGGFVWQNGVSGCPHRIRHGNGHQFCSPHVVRLPR